MSDSDFGPGVEVYKVGGAVRDELLNVPYHETDWVVVGATPETLIASGFKQVGSDFPVFLHPATGEEYALARTERKSGPGYHGFVVHADPDVTLEEDLSRRDLTINAMAKDAKGQLIDPYGGRTDIAKKRLRHVSMNFTEDPLRVLRVCRFAARYAHLGFSVDPETLELMRMIVDADALAELAPDRIWRETERALSDKNPEIFIELLMELGAERGIYPCDFTATSLAHLRATSARFSDSLRRWAALTANDNTGVIQAHRMTVPKRHRQAMTYTQLFLGAPPASAADILALLNALDAFRQGSLVTEVLEVLSCIDPTFTPELITTITQARTRAEVISGAAFAAQGLKGTAIRHALEAERLEAIQGLL